MVISSTNEVNSGFPQFNALPIKGIGRMRGGNCDFLAFQKVLIIFFEGGIGIRAYLLPNSRLISINHIFHLYAHKARVQRSTKRRRDLIGV